MILKSKLNSERQNNILMYVKMLQSSILFSRSKVNLFGTLGRVQSKKYYFLNWKKTKSKIGKTKKFRNRNCFMF